MSDLEQHAVPFDPRAARNSRLRRGIYLLPSVFTVANLLCGYYAVLATLLGTAEHTDPFNHAAKAIGFAILFDALDGRLARLTGTNTEFGKQFDSIADVVSFGIAPAVLAYAWGVRFLPGADTIQFQRVSDLGWVCCLFFLISCAWRLARFNVQGMAPGSSRYFLGLPTPAAAGVIASIVHAFHRATIQDIRWSIAWLLLAAGLGALMTSRIRFSSFKDVAWTRRQPSSAIVLLALLFVAIWFYSEYVLLLLATTYAATNVALQIVRTVRHRLVSRTV